MGLPLLQGLAAGGGNLVTNRRWDSWLIDDVRGFFGLSRPPPRVAVMLCGHDEAKAVGNELSGIPRSRENLSRHPLVPFAVAAS